MDRLLDILLLFGLFGDELFAVNAARANVGGELHDGLELARRDEDFGLARRLGRTNVVPALLCK